MTTLVELCNTLEITERESVDGTLKKLKHIEKYKLNKFCITVDVEQIQELAAYQPRLCAFNVSAQVLDTLTQLHNCCKSNTFMLIWNSQCKDASTLCGTFDDVIEKIWTPVRNRWDAVANDILTGEITFKQFEELLGKLFRDDYELMEAEMTFMNVSDLIMIQRLDQLRMYRHQETCVKGAKIILKISEQFTLCSGSFDLIKEIANFEETEQAMKRFDTNRMNALHVLKDFTPQKQKCLNTFISCERVVKWLRHSFVGRKAFKVFVEFAFLSAGDEPINISRVLCLFTAVMGYAPLIFDLDETCDLKQLLYLISSVWKELDASPNLLYCLQDTNRQLNWLKDIRKKNTSDYVEIMQAEEINNYGIYRVGKRVTQRHNGDGTIKVVADVVQLTVQEREINYTFLEDLKNRLLQICNNEESTHNAERRFIKIFDCIARLGSAYVKLCSSGCVLFDDFSARFFCDSSTERPVFVFLAFCKNETVPYLQERKSFQEESTQSIVELAKYLEKCLEDWMEHIKETRKCYLQLNYFTLDQLVILQREIVKAGTEEESKHLYPLLSAVKANCTQDDLLEAIKAAKAETHGAEFNAAENKGMQSDELDEAKQRFINELLDAGYDQAVAVRALDFVDTTDVVQGIAWCMDNKDSAMSDGVESEAKPSEAVERTRIKQEPILTGWSQSSTDIQTLVAANMSRLNMQQSVGAKPLIENLSTLWKAFLDSHISDYLSVEQLGLILTLLARKNIKNVCRNLSPPFKEGQPNLILCPLDDVLMTTLSIYKMDTVQSLPQSDEVLICTPNTTKDEVDIFWRRAIYDSEQKIHCLSNVDLLDYDVSEAAERCLEEYLEDVNEKELKYRLVVICGLNNEYKSGIVSALKEFKRNPLAINMSHLHDYLVGKLILQEENVHGLKLAASRDKKRSFVQVITSLRAGMGKTLLKTRLEDQLSVLNGENAHSQTISIPLYEKNIDLYGVIIAKLLEHTARPGETAARIFHIDVSDEVNNATDYLLFNLLVLGCLTDKTGFVWRESTTDIFLIEAMPLMMQAANRKVDEFHHLHSLLEILPKVTCRSPLESLEIYKGRKPKDFKESDQLFDDKQFRSKAYQRTFLYLIRLDQGKSFADVNPNVVEGTPQTCLETLLRHFGLEDPTWFELHNFVRFLNTQLEDFEHNSFTSVAAADDLPGFTMFVLRCLIEMSRDLSMGTVNANIREECPDSGEKHAQYVEGKGGTKNKSVSKTHKTRKSWKSSSRPYLFFNSDRSTFSFFGTFTRKDIETCVMAPELYDYLLLNCAPLNGNVDDLSRQHKIAKLCVAMGVEFPYDPDESFELTADNMMKIIEIHMKFRCDIPVILMGETGCGKTRLIKFMCALQVPKQVDVWNLIVLKVHGGTTNRDIIRTLEEAVMVAKMNRDIYGKHMYTVLFVDGANTSESIRLIKEIMCDRRMEGRSIEFGDNLKLVAACNPYRKLSKKCVTKLELTHQGNNAHEDVSTDNHCRVPSRELVYNILPQSLLPLVCDFGRLNTQVEELCIRQMVRRYINENKLPDIPNLMETVSVIVIESQKYMRSLQDDSIIVSLRDVERSLMLMSWFYRQSQENGTLFQYMDLKLNAVGDTESESDDKRKKINMQNHVDDLTRSLILALGVCYHACLKSRPKYRAYIAKFFSATCQLTGGADQIAQEIACCQEVILDHIDLEKNIARNKSLKENVFMIVVCTELRIPLFLIGQTGNSKSLAKSIVSDNMLGSASRSDLFKELKQTQMVSSHCSPLTTSDDIVRIFGQCACFQRDRDLDAFVSVVALDNIDLVENNFGLPLSRLHHLLDAADLQNEKHEKYKKVSFIGTSNFALDPALMNRGIVVQVEAPDLAELVDTARGAHHDLLELLEPLIEPLAISYLEVCNVAEQYMKEYYSLRDFYSFFKTLCGFVQKSKKQTTWCEMIQAIKRSFGGLEHVDPVQYFQKNLSTVSSFAPKLQPSDPDFTIFRLIQAGLFDTENQSRYPLLLTENMYGALSIIKQTILSSDTNCLPIIIMGSSFKKDKDFTQTSGIINKIKMCMEGGKTLILGNHENLYECLLDALDQNYVHFAGIRYVDLGLRTHREKCQVHKLFRMIIVADKQTVYKRFSLPVISRLEKHILSFRSLLSPEQQEVVMRLEAWAKQFAHIPSEVKFRNDKNNTQLGDVFIGYNDDTCSATVLDVWEKIKMTETLENRQNKVFEEAKFVLLWCATLESVIGLSKTELSNQEQRLLITQYFYRQKHENLIKYLKYFIGRRQIKECLTQNVVKASYAERAIKTIKGRLVRYMTQKQFHRWIDVLQSKTESYKKTYHRSIKRAPQNVKQSDSTELGKLQYDKSPTQENNVNYFVTQNVVKASYAERAIKTIKGRLVQNMTHKQVHRWIEVTTYSKLLERAHRQDISKATGINAGKILLLNLMSFDTELQFRSKIQKHIQSTDTEPNLMVIQCEFEEKNANLIAFARHIVMDEVEKVIDDQFKGNINLVFIVKLGRGSNFTGFQCGKWHTVHIDELYTEGISTPTIPEKL